jgi:hypothetical protein
VRKTERERIIQLSGRIQILRENLAHVKEELHEAERELDLALHGGEAALAPAAVPLVDRILRVLDSDLEAAWPIEAIQAGIGGEGVVGIASLRSTLARLAQDGRILRSGRGMYLSSRSTAVTRIIGPMVVIGEHGIENVSGAVGGAQENDEEPERHVETEENAEPSEPTSVQERLKRLTRGPGFIGRRQPG